MAEHRNHRGMYQIRLKRRVVSLAVQGKSTFLHIELHGDPRDDHEGDAYLENVTAFEFVVQRHASWLSYLA